MATLQAARAHALGLTLPVAKSWGLNRAIYYAAAKRGFAAKGTGPARPETAAAAPREFVLGDDKAYQVMTKGGRLFTIGGQVQTPEAFKKQVEQRFTGTFREAWVEALRIVKTHSKTVLESPQLFYGQVYRPRRDDLAKKWTERAASSRKPEGPDRSHRA